MDAGRKKPATAVLLAVLFGPLGLLYVRRFRSGFLLTVAFACALMAFPRVLLLFDADILRDSFAWDDEYFWGRYLYRCMPMWSSLLIWFLYGAVGYRAAMRANAMIERVPGCAPIGPKSDAVGAEDERARALRPIAPKVLSLLAALPLMLLFCCLAGATRMHTLFDVEGTWAEECLGYMFDFEFEGYLPSTLPPPEGDVEWHSRIHAHWVAPVVPFSAACIAAVGLLLMIVFPLFYSPMGRRVGIAGGVLSFIGWTCFVLLTRPPDPLDTMQFAFLLDELRTGDVFSAGPPNAYIFVSIAMCVLYWSATLLPLTGFLYYLTAEKYTAFVGANEK